MSIGIDKKYLEHKVFGQLTEYADFYKSLSFHIMTSDYIDSLEMGMTPEEDSQYYVAAFIQDIFDKVIKAKRIDIVAEIKSKTTMRLE